jgi:hypothetical protein
MTNVELMNSFYFIFLKEQSEATSTIRHSSIVIRHSIKLHISGAAGQKNGQSDQKRNFWDSVWKSAVVGFRISL